MVKRMWLPILAVGLLLATADWNSSYGQRRGGYGRGIHRGSGYLRGGGRGYYHGSNHRYGRGFRHGHVYRGYSHGYSRSYNHGYYRAGSYGGYRRNYGRVTIKFQQRPADAFV